MAMEVLLDKGYTAESCAEGFNLAEKYIREFFPPEWETLPKHQLIYFGRSLCIVIPTKKMTLR
jgi:endonuclease III